MKVNLTIGIPSWLDKICAWPVIVYRLWKYGYAYRRIYLGEGRFTIVDPQDYYWLNYFHWCINGRREQLYAIRSDIVADGKAKFVRMHREIMKPPKGLVVDHRFGNTLDNRRANLRLATKAQNMQNRRKRKDTSSQFIGVSFDKNYKKWVSQIVYQRKRKWLGRFDDEINAAKAYDEAAKKHHGEFARLNFTEDASPS
jgi:hypothetical protein